MGDQGVDEGKIDVANRDDVDVNSNAIPSTGDAVAVPGNEVNATSNAGQSVAVTGKAVHGKLGEVPPPSEVHAVTVADLPQVSATEEVTSQLPDTGTSTGSEDAAAKLPAENTTTVAEAKHGSRV